MKLFGLDKIQASVKTTELLEILTALKRTKAGQESLLHNLICFSMQEKGTSVNDTELTLKWMGQIKESLRHSDQYGAWNSLPDRKVLETLSTKEESDKAATIKSIMAMGASIDTHCEHILSKYLTKFTAIESKAPSTSIPLIPFCNVLKQLPHIRMGSGYGRTITAVHTLLTQCHLKHTPLLFKGQIGVLQRILTEINASTNCIEQIVNLLNPNSAAPTDTPAEATATAPSLEEIKATLSKLAKSTRRALDSYQKTRKTGAKLKNAKLRELLYNPKFGLCAQLNAPSLLYSTPTDERESYLAVACDLISLTRSYEAVAQQHFSVCVKAPIPLDRGGLGRNLEKFIHPLSEMMTAFCKLPKLEYTPAEHHRLTDTLMPPLCEATPENTAARNAFLTEISALIHTISSMAPSASPDTTMTPPGSDNAPAEFATPSS